ncbi:MAG: hypothetical protein GY835_01460 [bacterium]|nr:hypothetical protein [bacterium]
MRWLYHWAILVLLLLVGCALTYKGPKIEQRTYTKEVPFQAEVLHKKITGVLFNQGFAIASDSPGMVTTERKIEDLNDKQADCGSTGGIPYLRDSRTTTWLTISIRYENGRVGIRTIIEGEFMPNDPLGGKKFECVSKGVIERVLFERIVSH